MKPSKSLLFSSFIALLIILNCALPVLSNGGIVQDLSTFTQRFMQAKQKYVENQKMKATAATTENNHNKIMEDMNPVANMLNDNEDVDTSVLAPVVNTTYGPVQGFVSDSLDIYYGITIILFINFNSKLFACLSFKYT